MNEQSPFPFQGPLAPGEVSGRGELRQDLAERLSSHRVTALLGPRRYGKTSLLRQVTSDLGELGLATVWIDLYELSSMADLAGAVDRALDATKGRLRRTIDALTDSLTFRIGTLGVELGKSARERPDPVLVLRTFMQALVESAQHHQLIIVFDEFSGIAGVPRAAGLLRTELQHHYRELGIAFAGSEPSTMRTLFSDQAQPFFAQADLIELGPMRDDDITQLVDEGFRSTGRDAGPTPNRIAQFAYGHPQRAMQLADAVWAETPPGGRAGLAQWETALSNVRVAVDAGSERLFSLLTDSQRRVLRVLSRGGSVYGAAAEVVQLTSGAVAGAVEGLVDRGFIRRTEGRMTIVDPLLSDWMRRRFPI